MSLPSTFKALVSNGDKTASVKSIPLDTDLKPDEVLVRVRSVGLNPIDWKLLKAFDMAPEGVIIGCDAAGDVVRLGANVKNLKIGDRVAAFFYGSSSKENGAYAEYARTDSSLAIKVPDTVSYNEAASLPISHITAAQGLYAHFRLPPPSRPANKEDIILVWGGSTATGHHVIQLAVQSGLRVFATASKAAHEYLKGLGVEKCFDYRDEDVVAQIKEAAGATGVKYAFDTIAEGGTGVKAVDAIGPQGGKVIVLLAQQLADTQGRRPDVEVTFILIYLILGQAFGLPYMPQDRAVIASYLADEFPNVVKGWKEGEGSAKLKLQKLRVLESGLEKVYEGMDIMLRGEYGREKLVSAIP